MKTNVHVVYSKSLDKWQVKKDGVKTPVSQHSTQENARKAGVPIAKDLKSDLRIHRKDGTIRDTDSYGNDPRNIKDRVH